MDTAWKKQLADGGGAWIELEKVSYRPAASINQASGGTPISVSSFRNIPVPLRWNIMDAKDPMDMSSAAAAAYCFRPA